MARRHTRKAKRSHRKTRRHIKGGVLENLKNLLGCGSRGRGRDKACANDPYGGSHGYFMKGKVEWDPKTRTYKEVK